MPSPNPYQLDLDKNAANYVPLTPLTCIRRTAEVYPERTAVIHGSLKRTWKQTYERCVRLASALKRRGIGLGDTVSLMGPNIPETLGKPLRHRHDQRGQHRLLARLGHFPRGDLLPQFAL